MRTRTILGTVLGCLALAAAAYAADPATGDEALVKACQGELADRLFGGAAHGETFVTAQDVKHEAERATVRLDLASGEGRHIAGTCIFRGGKLFDVKS